MGVMASYSKYFQTVDSLSNVLVSSIFRGAGLLVLALVVGCGPQSGAEPEALTLAEPLRLSGQTVQAEQSQVELQTASGKGVLGPALTLAVDSLQLLASTDLRQGHIDLLSMPLPEVTLAADLLPPDGIALRDMVIGIAEPVSAEIVLRTESALALKARVPLRLSWSMLLPSGTVYPLGDVLTPAVDLAIDVEKSPAGLVTTVSTTCTGECWKAEGIFSIRDAKVRVVAGATITER